MKWGENEMWGDEMRCDNMWGKEMKWKNVGMGWKEWKCHKMGRDTWRVRKGEKWKEMKLSEIRRLSCGVPTWRFKEIKINMQTKSRQLIVTLWKRWKLIFIIERVIKQKWLSTTTTSIAIVIWILCHAEKY